MKKINFYTLLMVFILVPCYLSAGWAPDKGYFKTQKDIENDVSSFSASAASISFEGRLFYFINYNDGSFSKIIVRKLYNTMPTSINWNVHKEDDITNLKKLSAWQQWQPAPVVYNELLYLFVVNQEGSDYTHAYINYSVYNAADTTWSVLKKVMAPREIVGLGYMAAVVVGDKLCLITYGSNGKASVYWTNDLENWTEAATDLQPGGEISVITKNNLVISGGNKTMETIILIGYFDGAGDARYAEYKFDASNNLVNVAKTLIANEYDYSSIALAEGTVTGDPTTGKCIQAFLKKSSKDNGYCRYRILRYQLKEGGNWSKQENNLVKQNYLWADKNINLTVENFAIAETNTKDIRQFMCLIYRGYDDWDHPLNCAWAETDKLVYDPSKEMSQTMAGPGNTQYIGYIEGPPPFYLNNMPLSQPYLNPGLLNISELEFSTSSGTSTTTDIGYDVGGELGFKAGFFKAKASYSFGQAWGSEYSKKIINSVTVHASAEAKGYYITLSPTIYRAFYKIEDVHSNIIDSTYHFYMSDPVFNVEEAPLHPGLVPSDPTTYFQRQGINFPSYGTNAYGSASNSWNGGTHASSGIVIEQSESKTNTHKASLNFGFELGEMFDIGIEGGFDYSMKTTTSTGNEIKSVTRLNEAKHPTDVSKLNYTTHWINPVFSAGMNNWWLHEGAETQITWCITYDVTLIQYYNGIMLGDPNAGQESLTDNGNLNNGSVDGTPETNPEDQSSPTRFSLSQNYPNPFNSSTTIKYQIGDNESGGYMTRLVVYNLSGKEMAVLVNELKAPGSYEVVLEASKLSPGLYFYSLQSGNFKEVKKLILLK